MVENSPEITWWPHATDQLFGTTADSDTVAPLDFETYGRFFIADGYKHGADVMISHALNTRCGKEALIYPVLNSYRQYIELRLKEIIRYGLQPVAVARTHDLTHLWSAARSVIEGRQYGVGRDQLDDVEDLILEFAAVDPNSTAFRYAENPTTYLRQVGGVDLHNLREVMERLGEFLDEVSMVTFNGQHMLPSLEYTESE